MKRISGFIFIITAIVLAGGVSRAEAGQKLFVKSFSRIGFSESDPIGATISKSVESVFFDNGAYEPIMEEDVIAGAALDESKQALGCNDDRCMKSLLTASKIDLIVYGVAKKSNGYTYITGKLLDKSRGTVELARVKTVRIKDDFRNSPYFVEGITLLAQYLLNGKESDLQSFQDKMYVAEKRSEQDLRKTALEVQSKNEDDQFSKSVEKYKQRRKEEIAGKYSFWRFGYSQWGMKTKNDEFNRYYDRGMQFMTDLVVPFDRNSLSGMDFYFRYAYKTWKLRSDLPYAESGALYTDYISKGNRYTQNLFDLGFRYRLGLYFLMTKFDLYALGAGRMSVEGGFGFYGGAGVEIAFFQSLGFFAEYNKGQFKEGSANVDFENDQVIFGLTWRN
jgi:hypothetical protein